MEIEESFRDTKSMRYGIGLEATRSLDKVRLENLLLIGMLAVLALWLVGFATRKSKLHRRYQANTVTKTNVLSLIFLGMQVLRKRDLILSKSDLLEALKQLSNFGLKP